VAKAIPLTTRLCVEDPYIVVHYSWWLLIYILFELLSAKERDVGLGIEWPVKVDASASLDLRCGCLYDIVGEAVERAQLVIFAISEVVSGPPYCWMLSAYRPQAL
jgi:hypothetical protein